jgi:hypothetical protein
VIEINGAGSEATHIWDPKTSLFEAYTTQFLQWKYLFEVGKEVKQNYPSKMNTSVFGFFCDFFSLVTRKHKLNISS